MYLFRFQSLYLSPRFPIILHSISLFYLYLLTLIVPICTSVGCKFKSSGILWFYSGYESLWISAWLYSTGRQVRVCGNYVSTPSATTVDMSCWLSGGYSARPWLDVFFATDSHKCCRFHAAPFRSGSLVEFTVARMWGGREDISQFMLIDLGGSLI